MTQAINTTPGPWAIAHQCATQRDEYAEQRDELLAALKKIVATYEAGPQQGELLAIVKTARAAIAKAEGK